MHAHENNVFHSYISEAGGQSGPAQPPPGGLHPPRAGTDISCQLLSPWLSPSHPGVKLIKIKHNENSHINIANKIW